MNRSISFALALLLGISTSAFSAQVNFCIAVDGGWDPNNPGGTTFVGKAIENPSKGACQPWFGIVRTSKTVVGTSHGSICRSNDGQLLTVSLTSTLPEWFGSGRSGVSIDHIELCPLLKTEGLCPAHAGESDRGDLGSPTGVPAKRISCTPAMTTIPSSHD
jgi:hypothetical protein